MTSDVATGSQALARGDSREHRQRAHAELTRRGDRVEAARIASGISQGHGAAHGNAPASVGWQPER